MIRAGVPLRFAWLRLLVTALLLVAGLARPVVASAQSSGARRDREPMQVAAATGHGELCRLSERRTSDPAADGQAVLDELAARATRARGRLAADSPSALVAPQERVERVRVRGPPRA